MYRIQVMSPSLKGNERSYVNRVLDSTWIGSAGEFLQRFEREWAGICGTSDCLATANGTVSLHLAVQTLGAGPGDEVIVPALTYVATANAVRYVGAEPVFVDVDSATWCLDPAAIEGAISRRTRGIIPVHLFGHPADMDRIRSLASLYNLWILEDAAQGHFSSYKGRPVGSLGDMGSFSFHVGKMVTCGEGGALTFDQQRYSGWLRMLRGHGMDPERRFFHPVSGYNYRLTNMQAAILCAQIERRAEIVERRERIFSRYRRNLTGIPGIGFQPAAEWAQVTPWVFCLTIDESAFGRSRDDLIRTLDEQGIESRPFYIPLPDLPPFRVQSRVRGDVFATAERLSRTGMYLPSGTDLTDEEVDEVSDVVRRASGRRA